MIDPSWNGKPRTPAHTPTPGEVAKSITGRDYLSFSQLATFLACPLKWSYAYVENAPRESISPALLLGSGVHAAIQHYLSALMAADAAPSSATLMDVFRDRWRDQAGNLPVLYPGGTAEQTYAETARRMLEAFVGSRLSGVRGQLLGIEEELRVTLDEELPDLVAVVDRIELRGGELVISDYKTARTTWSRSTAEEHGAQLVLYGRAAQSIADDLNATVRLEVVVITKTKTPKVESVDVAYEPSGAERIVRVMKQVFRSMQTGVVYPSPSAVNCCTCPYRQRCSKWHRSSPA